MGKILVHLFNQLITVCCFMPLLLASSVAAGNWTQYAKVTASDGLPNDWFGLSVAIDGNTMVIGASGEDSGGSAAGAAYVYTRTGSTWTGVAKLTASDAQAEDAFGESIAISGEVIIVGAKGEDGGKGDPLSGAGAAYVFSKPAGGGWIDATEDAKLTASDALAGDDFGISVDISGDTIIIGARGEDGGAGDPIAEAGAAYIFVKPASGGWVNSTETAKLTASEAQPYDFFGISVAISDATIVVGARGEDGGAGDPLADAGAAYIFVRPGTGTWVNAVEDAKLTASDAQAGDHLGISVSISGDTVVTGARYENGGSGDLISKAGAAYLFVKPETGWTNATEAAKLTASDAQQDDYFGESVAVSGDTVTVGVRQEDGGSGDPLPDAGAAYIFIKPETGWLDATEDTKLTGSDTQTLDRFGCGVALSGNTMVVGANGEDGGPGDPLANSGAVYVYYTGSNPNPWPIFLPVIINADK